MKSTPNGLEQRFEAFERTISLSAPAELHWNTCDFTYHAQDNFFHALPTKKWLGLRQISSEHNSGNKIKVHLTCGRCVFPFVLTSSFMEPSLIYQRSFLQGSQLSCVGPGHQSSMSLLRHWFPGSHGQAMEFGVYISLENICGTSSRRRCKYKSL